MARSDQYNLAARGPGGIRGAAYPGAIESWGETDLKPAHRWWCAVVLAGARGWSRQRLGDHLDSRAIGVRQVQACLRHWRRDADLQAIVDYVHADRGDLNALGRRTEEIALDLLLEGGKEGLRVGDVAGPEPGPCGPIATNDRSESAGITCCGDIDDPAGSLIYVEVRIPRIRRELLGKWRQLLVDRDT